MIIFLLDLIQLFKQQQFNECHSVKRINENLREVNIKNHQNYFLHNIKNFDPNLLSVDQISFKKNIDSVLYNIEYFKKLNSKNSLYLASNNLDAYIEDKYLVFDLMDKNKEALENYTEFWDEIKD